MNKHFNLYYIFREEKVQLALSEEKSEQILAFLEEFFRTSRADLQKKEQEGNTE